jgi:hypothetical protein
MNLSQTTLGLKTQLRNQRPFAFLGAHRPPHSAEQMLAPYGAACKSFACVQAAKTVKVKEETAGSAEARGGGSGGSKGTVMYMDMYKCVSPHLPHLCTEPAGCATLQ